MSLSTTAMASFSPPTTHFPSHSKPHLLPIHRSYFLTLRPNNNNPPLLIRASSDNGLGTSSTPAAVTAVEPPPPTEQVSTEPPPTAVESSAGTNGSVSGGAVEDVNGVVMSGFVDPRWVGGTWDLKQFQKNGNTDWDAVIDAEARRRKWLEDYPESSNNENPVVFDTSIIPWWAWMKRFHLPEAELLNGRAAMIGFFMAYFVDSLTGVGLVDQMNNFFCKTLLFVAVVGVLLIRKNEDVENVKKLWEETTFYDKQWQATWQDENLNNPKKE